MRYELYFREIKIGVVSDVESDFPNLWGTIAYDESLTQPTTDERKRLARFVELNRESIRLVDIEHEQDVTSELDAINKHLESYYDFIETDDWILVSDNGERIPILCPIFRHDGEIVWRWNPQHGAH